MSLPGPAFYGRYIFDPLQTNPAVDLYSTPKLYVWP